MNDFVIVIELVSFVLLDNIYSRDYSIVINCKIFDGECLFVCLYVDEVESNSGFWIIFDDVLKLLGSIMLVCMVLDIVGIISLLSVEMIIVMVCFSGGNGQV